jgi:hypothetical protein
VASAARRHDRTDAQWAMLPPALPAASVRGRPDRVLADKAYTSRANRAYLKLAVRYEATITIAAINQRLRALRNTA